jgi:hypothetical protein
MFPYMGEKAKKPETPQDMLKTAYKNFVSLAQRYGQPVDMNGFTFKKYIPCSTDDCNLVHGRYFGPESNTVSIFYKKDNEAFQFNLSRDSLGNVSVNGVVFFEPKVMENGVFLVSQENPAKQPDVQVLNDLIMAAEKQCKVERVRGTERRHFATIIAANQKTVMEQLAKERNNRKK